MKYHISFRLAEQVVGALALLLLVSGCQTYQQQTSQFAQTSTSSSLLASVSQIDKLAAESAGSKDEIVFRLEQGATLRTAALANPSMVPDIRPPALPPTKEAPVPEPRPDPTPEEVMTHYFNRSIEAFNLAEERIDHWEEQARVKAGAEAGALVSNQASLPYRGRAYDKVMMNAYKALNYLALGEKDKARVELNRALQRQRDAVEENQSRIAAAQEEAELARKGELKDEKGKTAAYDAEKATGDAKTGPALQEALKASIAPMKPYGDYVNPYAVFLDGLFFTILGEDGSDLERGRKSFERVAEMVPDNAYVQEDLDAATAAAEGIAPEGVTYVIFETGTAPARSQLRIDIPTFLVTSNLAYVGAAFPKLEYKHAYVDRLDIVLGEETTLNTATVASMDSVIANDFKNEWPAVVSKTLVTAATKAIAQAVVQKELNSRGGWAGMIGAAVLSGASASTNIADTRSWLSLPKEFQYARFATPESRELLLRAGEQESLVSLPSGSVNVVYVKSSSSAAPLLISSFALQ